MTWYRRSLPLALVLVAVTCESPVTSVACSKPTLIQTYSGGYEVERNICFDSGAIPPYAAQSSDMEVATVASNGNKLFVTGQNPGNAEITVSAADQNGNAGAVNYTVVTQDPWTQESFECSVTESEPTDAFPEGYYEVGWGAEVRAEVDMAELVLLVHIDEYLFWTGTNEDVVEGQRFVRTVGGAMNKAHHDIDVNDYQCTLSGVWTY